MPPTKPLNFAQGGDAEWTPLVDFEKGEPKPGFEDVPELETADERVKKIFSMDFADGRIKMLKEMETVMAAIQDHPADVSSLESQITKQTVHIRKQISHCLMFRKDKVSKVRLMEGIQARRKWLKELRQLDKEKFDWICKELNLTYISQAEIDIKIPKAEARRLAARQACWSIIDQKMAQLKEKLEEEKVVFKQLKEQELDKIEKELKELGIEMQPTIEQTIEAMNLGRQVFVREKIMKRRRAILQKKFQLYGIHGRDRGKDPRIKFT